MQALLQQRREGTGAQGDRVSGRGCVLCLQDGDAVHFRRASEQGGQSEG